MYRQVLRALWSALRLPVVLLTLVGFALPLLTVTYGGSLQGAPTGRVAEWLYAAQQIGVLIPGLALVLGLLLGLGAWMHDHAGKHVYALSLPVSRERYVWLRFAAGATLLLAPVLALGLGASIATLAVRLPTGVHAYPVALTGRFLMASLVCYAVFFAIAISTRRAAVAVLGIICGVLLADLLLAAIGVGASVTPTVFMWLTNWPGPLAILIGRWALFDV
jgi:ABC-type transport system involved in multi-copper enzyme maturation permease subunit